MFKIRPVSSSIKHDCCVLYMTVYKTDIYINEIKIRFNVPTLVRHKRQNIYRNK